MYLKITKWAKVALILVLTAGVIGGFATLLNEKRDTENLLEGVYEKSFYDLLLDVNDIEIKLEKLSVSNGITYQRELLEEVGERATLANANVAQLSQDKGVMQNTTRYINQVGDYAKSLSKKLDKGGMLNEEDKKNLRNLHKVSVKLGQKLTKIRDKIGEGSNFIQNFEDIEGDFGEIDDLSIDYPELIYDGPFSDSVLNKKPKGITGKKLDGDTAFPQAVTALGNIKAELEFTGKAKGKITTLNYNSKDGKIYIRLCENGQLLSLSMEGERVIEPVINEEDGVKIAYEYLYKNGFNDMTPVWYSFYDGDLFINFVSVVDGVVVYPDMVKVKVSGKTGEVIGFDGLSYAYNHVERDIERTVLNEEIAKSKVQSDIVVESVRLALIPKGEEEILTYEVFGEREGKKYFVYVDAKTGEEVNILCVIDSDNGDLLM